MYRLKLRIFKVIEPDRYGDKLSKIFDIVILSLITLNVACVIIESFPGIEGQYKKVFDVFEKVSIVIFTLEYLLRIYTAEFRFPGETQIKSIIKYIFSPMALVDLMAIIPFYLPVFIKADLRALRILRLTRLLRVLKFNRYFRSLQSLNRVLKKKKEELLITIFVTSLMLLLAASVMYYLENKAQPETFENIVASLWWAVATLTTVGYGDVYPITPMGKVLSALIALLGIGLVALPAGIISSGLMSEFSSEKDKQRFRKKKYVKKTIPRKRH